jgi:putative nucleotidyltransferase with HDIG domain
MLLPKAVRTPSLAIRKPGSLGAFYFAVLLVIPLVIMGVLVAEPAWDGVLSANWFHFQVVSFTSLVALVLAVLIGSLAGPVANLRTLFITFALMAISGVFLIHGISTPGVLFDAPAVQPAEDHGAHTYTTPRDNYQPPKSSAPTNPQPAVAGPSNAVLAVVWSAPISLFVGALLFGFAAVPWPAARQRWLLDRRRALWWVGIALYLSYVGIVSFFPQPLAGLATFSPVRLYALATLAVVIYAAGAWPFWMAFRRRGHLADAGLAVASGLLAEAVLSMATMPLWHASWWLYHVLMAVAFIFALGAVVIEYERARHFNLSRYFAALGVIVTALLAMLAGEFAVQLLAPFISPTAINAVRWGASGLFVGMAALMLGVLYQVVRRGDKLLREQSAALQKQQASLERSRIAESLLPIGLAINATLDLDKVLNTICAESVRLFGVDGAYLWLKEGNALVGRAGSGHKRDEFIGLRQPLTHPGASSARMLRERRPVLFNFEQARPANDDVMAQLDARAALGVPFVAGGETLGTLMLTYTRAGEVFEPVDLEVATIFGQQAATALTHARLYATIRRQVVELSTLLTVSTAVRQASGQREVIQTLLSQAMQMLKATGGAVQLIDAEQGMVRIVQGISTLAVLQDVRYPLEGSLAAHVVACREPDIDDGAERAWFTPPQVRQLAQYGNPILTLPMQAGDIAVGALTLAFPPGRRPSADELRLAQTIAEIGGIAIHRVALHETTERQAGELAEALSGLRGSYQATLQALSAALDARDRETEGHSQRVTRYALLLAKQLGLRDARTLESLEWGALLHDVGKIGVPDAILLKPARLTDEEWLQMRRHPETGFKILRDITFLRGALDVVLHHHERWDGDGYPHGLKGEGIPLPARIFSVADTLDAITTTRPYRAGRSFAEARAEIMRQRGTQFDPAIVDAFAAISDEAWKEAATATAK